MEAVASFVSTDRGLAWKHPVYVRFLPAAQFEAAINKESGGPPDPQSSEDGLDSMRAIGVTSGSPDLGRAAQNFADSDVIGLYVPHDKTVYVRGDQMNPYVRDTLAHELTHALQDQYFDLSKLKSLTSGEEAVTSLIEGDAVRVQNDYEAQMSNSDQQLFAKEQAASAGSARQADTKNGIPRFFIDQATFPYEFGPTFVLALVKEGGNAQVDAAFRNPPTVDGQIMNPTTFLPGLSLSRAPVAEAPVGSKPLDSGSFGEMSLFQMLAAELGYGPAHTAIQGWSNDDSVFYRQQDGKVCVDINVLDDSAADAATLQQTGERWATHLPGATASRSGQTVHFHSCDPGPGWRPAISTTEDPYGFLAAQSELAYQLMLGAHLDPPVALCSANAVAQAMGPADLVTALQSDDPNSAAIQQLRTVLAPSVRSCR